MESSKERQDVKRRYSVEFDGSEFTLDEEMLRGLFGFKSLLESKLIPSNFRSSKAKAGLANDESGEEEYELQRAKAQCPPQWAANILKVCFTSEQIQARVSDIGARISRLYEGQEIIVVGLLTGAICFMTDILKHLKVPYILDFIACSSYGKGTVSKGSPIMLKDMSVDPRGKHIVLIEDIIDTGRTLAWLKNYLSTKGCASVRIACLLDKKERRVEKQVHVDFIGFDCPNEFIVGYGMDFAGHYRGLPFIGVLKPEAYASISGSE